MPTMRLAGAKFAELYPEAVTWIDGRAYQPIIPTAEFQQLLAKGLSSAEIYAQRLQTLQGTTLPSAPSVPQPSAPTMAPSTVELPPIERYDLSGLTPEQLRILEAEVEEFGSISAALEAIGLYPTEIPRPLEEVFQPVFPGATEEEINSMLSGMIVTDELPPWDRMMAEQAQEEFLQAIIDAGRTAETERLLATVFPTATAQDLDELFGAPLGAEVAGTPIAVTEEGGIVPLPWWQKAWNSLYLGVRTGLQQAAQSLFTVILPNLFPYVREGQSKITGMTDEQAQERGVAYTAEEAAESNQAIEPWRAKFREVAISQEVKWENWQEKHPELQPKPEYRQDVFEHTELLEDPGWWIHTMAETTGVMLPSLVSGIAVTFATKRPLYGALTTAATMTPLEMQGLYEDLIQHGAPIERAEELALVVGAAIATVEVGPSLILMKAIYPIFKPFRRGLQNAVIKATMRHMIAKGVKNFTAIEVSEALEEVLQGVIADYTVSFWDENRDVIGNIPGTFLTALVGMLPISIFGGGMSMRRVSPEAAEVIPDEQKRAEGWDFDNITKLWYKPQKMVDSFNEDMDKAKEAGMTDEQAKLSALNEAARTPEGEEAIRKASEKIKEGVPVAEEVPPVAPEVTAPPAVEGVRPIPEPTVAKAPVTLEQFMREIGRDNYGRLTFQGKLVPYTEGQMVNKPNFTAREWAELGYENMTKEGLLPEVSPTPPAVEAVVPPVIEAPPIEVIPTEVEVRRQLDELSKMHDYWSNKLKTSDETKVSLAKYVRESLPLPVRGKFITSVAKVKTDAQLQVQMDKVKEVAELNAQKVLRAEIRKEIKKAQAKVKEHILKGKFTPDVQRRLDVLTHNLELDRDAAREKITQNITAYQEGKLGYDEMLTDNEMLNFAGIDGMSAEELSNTLEYIKVLETTGRSERQAKQEAETERIKATRSDISNILTGGQGLKTGIGAVPRGELTAKTGWWDAFTNWQYGIDNLADKLSKLDPTSKPYQSALSQFVAQVHRATNTQISNTKVAFNKVKDMVGEVYKIKSTHDINRALNALDEEVNLGVFELTEEYKANHPGSTTVTMKMTRNQMIAKYMQMQDYTLNNTFTTGMGWSQAVKDAVESKLTVGEKKLADALFGFYEEYYTATNEIYQELFNVDMPHNPTYSPIRRDFEADIIEDVLTMQDASQYASVLNGSLKARQRNIRPLRFNGALDILSNHIQQMEHFKAWATTMRDMRRVFGNKETRQAVEQYHGQGVLRLIDTFLNQMARGGIETAATNRAADYLRRNFTKSILAIKPVILLKQIPSLFGYISEMKVTEFVGGIAHFWTAPISHFNFLRANSKMFRARMEQGFERDIRAAMQKHGKSLISGRGKLTDWFLLQIRLGDTFAVTQGMWAKYRAGLNQGLTQEQAIVAAEDTTGRTQPSFGIDTLSAIQNGGSWLKLMTMFQNQPNKYFRMTGDNLRNFRYGRGSRAKAASTILLTWVLLPMMFQYIADAFQWKPERQARAGILGPLNFILIGGQLVQSMWGWLTDQPFDYQVSPVAQTGRDLQVIFQKARKMVEQGQDPYKDISVADMAALVEYLAKAAGQVLGLPTPYFVQLSKLLRHKFEAGEELQIKDFLFSEWALTPPEKNAEEKVEDINLKLGELKEGQEDRPETKEPLKLFTTVDWLRDIGKVYDNVLPQDVLDNPKSSEESKAWANYEIARSKADILPGVPLYKINTEDNADTIIELYKIWKAREGITSLAKLKEFDALYKKAGVPIEHGNVTRQQYNLLVKYLEAEDKDTFLEEHPELKINPRDEWLKVNPLDNAYLALGGQAKILTREAYDAFNKLVDQLDIPEDAIPEKALPPAEVAEAYFERNDIVDEWGANSWEDKLIRAKNPELNEWLGLGEIDTPIASLELKTEPKFREISNKLDDKDFLDALNDTIKDENGLTERDRTIAELKATKITDEYTYADIERKVKAIEKGTEENPISDDIVNAHVDYGRLIDQEGVGSTTAEVMLFRVDNPKYDAFRTDEDIWGEEALEPIDQAKIPLWRLQDNYKGDTKHYEDEIPEQFKDIANEDERDAKIAEARAKYLADNEKYRKAKRRIEGYGLVGNADTNYRRFNEEELDKYVEYYEKGTKGFRQERYLLADPKFAEVWHQVTGGDLPDPDTVPLVQYDDIYDKYPELFNELEGLDNNRSDYYIEDEDKRENRIKKLLGDVGSRKFTEFGLAYKEREAYDTFRPKLWKDAGLDVPSNTEIRDIVQNSFEWLTNPDLIRRNSPWHVENENAPFYEDDWWLLENKDFYATMIALGLWKKEREFDKVASRDTFNLYETYLKLAGATERIAFRIEHKGLDDWMLINKMVSKPAAGRVTGQIENWRVKLARELADLERKLAERRR